MNDLISRSALTDAIVDLLEFQWGYDGIREDVQRIFSEIPAVDAETVCEQMVLVKEALEMAKADLVAVVRCRDCVHYEFGFCVRSILYSKGPNGYCENGERRSDA